MKINTAMQQIETSINSNQFVTAAALLKKYQRKFGNRKFGCMIRCMIKNGIWANS